MESISSCKEKLFHFRTKELKDVLNQLSISKQGKKQDLVDRILAILSGEQVSRMSAKKNAVKKEDVVKLVEDTFRKMLVSGAPDLASKGPGVSETSKAKKRKGEIDGPLQSDSKTRCPCGSSLLTGSMIKCDDPACLVWQHTGCVIISEKPMEHDPPHPELFYCEICRLSRADPFWVSVAHPLYPLKSSLTTIPTDGANPAQIWEKTFQLTRADKYLLTKPEYDVQAWCMLLNDKVSFRMQWPQYADLQVNGILVRAINRPGAQLLGFNGRDDGPIITPWTKDGLNKIFLAGCDARIFCVGVRIVKRRSVQQILNLIPNESVGESFEDALARVCRCVNGGVSNDAESDSDVEVVAGSFAVNLRCPMSGSRMKVAGRFKPCIHMGCFDLEVFVEMNQRSRKWQCPICLNNYALENVIIDPYFNRITTMMHHCSEDVTEVELKSDGSWRAKTKSEIEHRNLGDLGQWHGPDGSLCVPTSGQTPQTEVIEQVKEECVTEDHPSLKLGVKKNSNGFWQVSKPEEKAESCEQKVISMSSSDGEDSNINQDMVVLESISLNPSAAQDKPEIVVLSDSDEDDVPLIYNHRVNNTCGVNPPGFSVSYASDPNPGPGDTSSLGLFNANDDEYVMPTWPLSNGNQNYPDGLVDNPLAFGAVDPSLQIFLPTVPSDASEPSDLCDQADVSNFVRTEDWISFKLGTRASVNRFNLRYHAPSNEVDALDSLADTTSLLHGMNDSESDRTRQRPDNPFPDHLQQRSVRPRLCLSVDSNSE